jgi:hypothetical protein
MFRQKPCDGLITRPTVCKNDPETEKEARIHGGCTASGKKKIEEIQSFKLLIGRMRL